MYYTLFFLIIISDIENISKSFYTRYFSCLFDVADVGNFLFQFAFFNSILTIILCITQPSKGRYIFILTVNPLHVLNFKPIIYTNCWLVPTAKL